MASSPQKELHQDLSAPSQSGAHLNDPIDMEHLSRQSLGDHALAQEILGMYDQMLCTQMDFLARADANDVLRILHSIKGASAGVGADDVARAAHELEESFKEIKVLDAGLMADLKKIVAQARDFIAATIEFSQED